MRDCIYIQNFTFMGMGLKFLYKFKLELKLANFSINNIKISNELLLSSYMLNHSNFNFNTSNHLKIMKIPINPR